MTAVQGYGSLLAGGLLVLSGGTGAIVTAAVRSQPAWHPRVGLWPWLLAAAVGLAVVAYFMLPVLAAPG